MQDNTGKLHPITDDKFKSLLKSDKFGANVVTIGDRFNIRGCRFEVTEITTDGIYAKGVKSGIVSNTTHKVSGKIGRNKPCPCGSGKKYKRCCGRFG